MEVVVHIVSPLNEDMANIVVVHETNPEIRMTIARADEILADIGRKN